MPSFAHREKIFQKKRRFLARNSERSARPTCKWKAPAHRPRPLLKPENRLPITSIRPIKPQLPQVLTYFGQVPHFRVARVQADGEVAAIRTDRQRKGARRQRQ